MATSSVITVTWFLYFSIVLFVKALECPSDFPYEINDNCFRFERKLMPFNDARDNCPKVHSFAQLASVRTEDVLKELQKPVYQHYADNTKKTSIWIGLQMNDQSISKAAEDRTWQWHWDEEEFIQKDFSLWDTEGGPTDKGLACGTVEANNFLVKPQDCRNPQLPLLCMMEKGKECKSDSATAPYLMSGKHCLAGMNGAFEYKHIKGLCNPNFPAALKDEEMRESINAAGKNLILGGAAFLNIQKRDGKFIDLGTNKEVNPDLWEEGEPREEYDCAGVALQVNDELKLKTIHCNFYAASICFFKEEGIPIE